VQTTLLLAKSNQRDRRRMVMMVMMMVAVVRIGAIPDLNMCIKLHGRYLLTGYAS
jgi:hypothetical protein